MKWLRKFLKKFSHNESLGTRRNLRNLFVAKRQFSSLFTNFNQCAGICYFLGKPIILREKPILVYTGFVQDFAKQI